MVLELTMGTDDTHLMGHADSSRVVELECSAISIIEASRTTSGPTLTGRIEIDGTNGTLSLCMERLNEPSPETAINELKNIVQGSEKKAIPC